MSRCRRWEGGARKEGNAHSASKCGRVVAAVEWVEWVESWGQVGAMTIGACAEPRAEVPQLPLVRGWPDPGCAVFHILAM